MFHHTQHFQHATELFYSTQYAQGLQLINNCITNDPTNSILYSNRALFYSQLDYIEQAFNDLNIAIELNYLNYIAYFNMFSLLMRCQRIQQAFQNLCCSLSCLYLIQAKTKKSEIDASKAIKYAENNLQAHVLKGLIHLENGKYKLAMNQLQWACQINPRNDIVKELRRLVYGKMNPGLNVIENSDDNNTQQVNNDNNTQGIPFRLRLQSSYTYEQSEREQQLRDRVGEFNQIYNKLNDYQGTITTKVPKQQQQQQWRQQQQVIEDVKGIDNNNGNNNNRISQQQLNTSSNVINDNGANTPSQLSLAPQPGQYPISYINNQSIDNNNNSLSQFHSINNYNNNNKFAQHQQEQNSSKNNNSQLILQFQSMIKSQYDNNNNLQGSLMSQNSNKQQLNNQFQSVIVCHDNQQQQQLDQQEQQQLEQQQQQQQQQQLEQQQSLLSTNNTLYPHPDSAHIQFSILKLQILSKTQQEINKLQNLYCIANYLINSSTNNNKNNNTFKLRTACQPGHLTGTQWNQTFQPILIPSQPQCMKIKVYNKKYSSYRDDLIGQMQVEITTHGLVKLPLFNKQGDLVATIMINLELVIMEQQNQQEEDVEVKKKQQQQ